MRRIDNISAEPYQELSIPLSDGSLVTMVFTYRAASQHWTVDVSWGTKTINGLGVCVHPNLLRPWRQALPFGLAIAATDGVDPYDPDDFVNGRIQAYLLEGDDLTFVEETVIPEAAA